MGKFLDLDGPVIRFLNKMADLLWLNILAIVMCIPIITAGASLTALHYSCLKLARGNEGYITKDFFRSFKSNFLQATGIWLIFLAVGAMLGADYYIILTREESTNIVIVAGLFIASIMYILTIVAVFPMQSHFVNTVGKTLRNSLVFSMSVLPRTLVVIAGWLLPMAVMLLVQPLFLLAFLFLLSLPAYITALMYNSAFKKYEPEEKDTNDDFSWSVNSDIEENSVEGLSTEAELGDDTSEN